MKPVSQGPPIQAEQPGMRVVLDPDVTLIKDYFSLNSSLDSMSPVVVGPGYTRAFIDGTGPTMKEQDAAVMQGFDDVSVGNDTIIVEGTGHTGVGSIIGAWADH